MSEWVIAFHCARSGGCHVVMVVVTAPDSDKTQTDGHDSVRDAMTGQAQYFPPIIPVIIYPDNEVILVLTLSIICRKGKAINGVLLPFIQTPAVKHQPLRNAATPPPSPPGMRIWPAWAARPAPDPGGASQ